jgi:hypothetical protein
MHIVHSPANGLIENREYTTATDYEDSLAMLAIWFEELDCESMS